ncbi:MAG: EF-hand domain-containing protein, partial [Planctomycetaceae bacterium]|nr:EF-hand domain-containing protein [Planctomycetaceae bacterium]
MYRYFALIILMFFAVPVRAEESSFNTADTNKDGTVSQEEFQRFLASYSKPQTAPVKKTEFTLADKNGDGFVSEKEFVDFINASTAPPPVTQYDDQTAFAKADINGDGLVSPEELALYRSQNAGKNFRTVSNKTEQLPAPFEYKGPLSMAANKNGTKIYAVCFDAGEIAVVDTAENKVFQTFFIGNEPTGIALSSDEKTIYVTFGGSRGQISALDAESGKTLLTVSAGHTPMAPVLTPDGTKLFLCNRFNADVTEYTLPEMKLVRHLKVIREPCAAAVTKNGKHLLVLNSLPNDPNCFPDNPESQMNVAAA